MKNHYLLVFLLLSCGAFCQKIKFEYDAAGNQISRTYCISCSSKKANTKDDTIAEPKKEDFQKFLPTDEFSYYPNPVKEELHLNWKFVDGRKLTKIQIFELNGTLKKNY